MIALGFWRNRAHCLNEIISPVYQMSDNNCMAIGFDATATPDPLVIARWKLIAQEKTSGRYWQNVNDQRRRNGLPRLAPSFIEQQKQWFRLTPEDVAILEKYKDLSA